MRLFLVQHGDALPKDVDPDRPLSDQGRADVERLAWFLDARGISARHVCHSGKTRARETAEILAAALAPAAAIEVRDDLNPNDSTDGIAESLTDWEGDDLVVGHLPYMARLVSRLVAKSEDQALVAYTPGSLVCLERNESGAWIIAWMLRPDVLG